MQPQEKNPYRVEQTTSLTGGFDSKKIKENKNNSVKYIDIYLK